MQNGSTLPLIKTSAFFHCQVLALFRVPTRLPSAFSFFIRADFYTMASASGEKRKIDRENGDGDSAKKKKPDEDDEGKIMYALC